MSNERIWHRREPEPSAGGRDLPGKKMHVPVFQGALDTKRTTPSAQVYKVFLHTWNDAKGIAPYVTNNMHP